MARLYLISDILHNSASPLPNVWKYRLAFETRLPPVFTHFCAVHRSLNAYSGKIAADVFKQQVLGMVEIWENWYVPAVRGRRVLTAEDRLHSWDD